MGIWSSCAGEWVVPYQLGGELFWGPIGMPYRPYILRTEKQNGKKLKDGITGRNSLLKQETGSGDNKDHSPSSSTVSKSEAKTPAILDVRNEDNKDQKLKCDRSTSSMKSVLQMVPYLFFNHISAH